MTHTSSLFDFSRLLAPEVIDQIADTSTWCWRATFGYPTLSPIEHRSHARWLKVKGNTHNPPHREVMLTIRGSAVYSIDQKLYMRSPGTVILLNSHQQRDLKSSPDKRDFSCLWLQLHGGERLSYYLNNCDRQGRHQHDAPSGIKSGESIHLIADIWDHCELHPNDRMAWSLLQNSISTILLDVLGRITTTTSRSQQQEINSVAEYIHNHLAEKLNLHTLARIAGYSPFFFHRLFVRYTGHTPVSYINEARLIRAKQLLADNHTVESVSEAVGFQSTSYFTQFFRKQTGLTPHAWRLKQQ